MTARYSMHKCRHRRDLTNQDIGISLHRRVKLITKEPDVSPVEMTRAG